MEEVSLTETETRYYSDLFICCDTEKTGKISMLKATELYRSANLSNDVILMITSLAGIPDTALHISRVQFYSCLKLIAAYQAGMPLRQELVAASLQLPLPRFSWKESPNTVGDCINSTTTASACGNNSTVGVANSLLHNQSNGLNVVPPPTDRENSLPRQSLDWQEAVPVSSSRRNSAQQQQQQRNEVAVNSDVPSTDSEVEQNESSCGGAVGGGTGGGSSRDMHRRRRGSPEAWSTNSDSPTPTNSVAERPWAKETLWQGLLGDEHRQLLGTEEESSDRHSSDDDNETDLESVYQITFEQRDYYYKQFKAVQHDPNGLLSGQVARVFFEKSRIPVEELRHIWQLCDVTRDGALSLAEFTAAMHLVVLRRNNIPLPTVLPACLHPSVLQRGASLSQAAVPVPAQTQEPPEADLLHLNDDDDDIDNTDNTIIGGGDHSGQRAIAGQEKNAMNISTISTTSQSSIGGSVIPNHSSLTPPVPPSSQTGKQRSISNSPNQVLEQRTTTSPNLPKPTIVKQKDQNLWAADNVPPSQWTKFTESPTSNVSSPGPKPVNFDMQRTAQAVVSDPQILHPVPLRVTPIAGNSNTGTSGITTSAAAVALTSTTTETLSYQDSYEGNNGGGSGSSGSGGGGVVHRDTSPKQITYNASISTTAAHQRDSLQNNDSLRAIQRPQAKKLPAKNIGALPPPPQREPSIGSGNANVASGADGDVANMSGSYQTQQSTAQVAVGVSKKDPPPVPPPRPHRHGRSSSLDLNKFKMTAPGTQQPEITTQASFDLQTSTGFADFTHFPDGSASNVGDNLSEQQHSLPPQPTPMLVGNNNIKSGSIGDHLTTIPTYTQGGQSQQQVISSSGMPLPTRFSLQSNQNQRVSAFEVYRKPNTSRNSKSPPANVIVAAPTSGQQLQLIQQQQQFQQPPPSQPPPPAPFGAGGATAIAALPNADHFEKRVNAISETLRHVSFKPDNNITDVLRHLREQNNLLLRLCNDLSDELLTVQTRKEEMRIKLETITGANNEMTTLTVVGQITTTTANAIVSGVGSGGIGIAQIPPRTGSSISAPVTTNITGGSGSSGLHSNV